MVHFLVLDEFATPLHQEQIAVEQFVHFPLPQNLEQIVEEGVKEIPQERLLEQTVGANRGYFCSSDCGRDSGSAVVLNRRRNRTRYTRTWCSLYDTIFGF